MFVVCVRMGGGGVTVILEWQNPKPDPVEAWKNRSTYSEGKGRVGGSSKRMYNDYHTEAVGRQLFQRRNDVEESVRFR